MPLYEYRCAQDHRIEVMHGVDGDGPARCAVCGGKLERVLFAPAIQFHGPGFHNTDYPRPGR